MLVKNVGFDIARGCPGVAMNGIAPGVDEPELEAKSPNLKRLAFKHWLEAAARSGGGCAWTAVGSPASAISAKATPRQSVEPAFS